MILKGTGWPGEPGEAGAPRRVKGHLEVFKGAVQGKPTVFASGLHDNNRHFHDVCHVPGNVLSVLYV